MIFIEMYRIFQPAIIDSVQTKNETYSIHLRITVVNKYNFLSETRKTCGEISNNYTLCRKSCSFMLNNRRIYLPVCDTRIVRVCHCVILIDLFSFNSLFVFFQFLFLFRMWIQQGSSQTFLKKLRNYINT
jgi:hypothetical protein